MNGFPNFRRTAGGWLSLLLMGVVSCAPPEESAVGTVISEAEARAAVAQHLPASAYVTNDFLPPPDADLKGPPPFPRLETPIRLAVSMPWVLNDEEAPWYVAIERGYFAEVGLEVELLPGGPGIDPLALLVGGRAQIGVPASTALLQRLLTSRTSADVVAIGAKTKRTAYVWLALDAETPRGERSNRAITREDLIGKTVGVQAGYEWIWPYLAARWDLPLDAMRVRKVGFTPDPLVAGVVDYYAAWIVNQPRSLEAQGIFNWIALDFGDLGLNEYMDVSVVLRPFLEREPETVRRYLWALAKAMQTILNEPEIAAEITVRYARDADLTLEQVLRRFEFERALILEVDELPPLYMRTEVVDELATRLYQYGQIEIRATP